MIFGKGRIPKAEFEIRGEKIDIVKQFSYLGVILTPQLSFACHARALVSKARARIAYLFMSLPLRKMSLEIVVRIFETYLLPVFSYCAPIWTYNLNGNSIQSMNSVFTSYLKRYLGLPKYLHNAAVHYYCKTWPLYNAVKFAARNAVSRIQFRANSLDGLQLSFVIESYVPPMNLARKCTTISPEGKCLFQETNIIERECLESCSIRITINIARMLNFM